ncbi:methyltransferase [Scytonema hofmannii PCC 7110]|uniref:Methyltransferase n=1 Tax=Scytonema hofmannii PCC 7110 TaxID=128403 RepID=A0A139WXP2_9CYAN|nr:methyltransferase [Scytonema hofmannii]KYC37196.1 methyltransferase [Scytonema hofmannii PCC 7110]
MTQAIDKSAINPIPQPQTDGTQVWDAIVGLHGHPTVLVAHELKLFPLLAETPRTLQEISQSLNLAPRAASAVLSICTSMGFIQLKDGYYSLTLVACEYLLESSPTSFCGWLDLMIANANSFSYEGIKEAILTDAPVVYEGDSLYKVHEQEDKDEQTRIFTRAMHSASVAPALAWPTAVDLSGNTHMLDIAGGSGAHSIGATLKWSNLRSTILDIAPVCQVAQEYIAQYKLQEQISTQVSDMWNDPFPSADLHFYSLIYHNYDLEKNRFLTKKSFDCLEPGGRIIIHQWLFNHDRTGPLATAAYNIMMQLWCAGGQEYSDVELSNLLAEVGFVNIEVKPTFGYWSIVTGRKIN